MHLVIFDIDGTIADTVKTDDWCFVQALEECFAIQLVNTDWLTFVNVTDTGLVEEIFQNNFGRIPTPAEMEQIEHRFLALWEAKADVIVPVPGFLAFFQKLQENPVYQLAFATGGWRSTAQLKLKKIGVNPDHYILATASEFKTRQDIMKSVVDKAEENNVFERITYIGDGLWDAKITAQLGYRFIGVDMHQTNRLLEAGYHPVVSNFESKSLLFDLLND